MRAMLADLIKTAEGQLRVNKGAAKSVWWHGVSGIALLSATRPRQKDEAATWQQGRTA